MRFILVDKVNLPNIFGMTSSWWMFKAQNPKRAGRQLAQSEEFNPGLQFMMSEAQWKRRNRPTELEINLPGEEVNDANDQADSTDRREEDSQPSTR